jgi:hypothetical protein
MIGTLTFYIAAHDMEFPIKAVADSYAGDELMLGYCCSKGSKEGNDNLFQYR